ncbi:MAG: putative Ig domain-containing protein [Planctomycetota bacterium]
MHQETRRRAGARFVAGFVVAVAFAGILSVWSHSAIAVAPDGGDQVAPHSAVKPAPLGVGSKRIGLLPQPNGQWHLRQPIDRELPGATPGQSGAGIADACIAWVAQQPAQFANLAASSLRLKRLHPVPIRPRSATALPGFLWSVEFEQLVGGRPVEDAVLQFHVEDRANLTWCTVRLLLGRFFPTATDLPASLLDDDACRKAAARAVGLPVAGLPITRETHSVRVQAGSPVPVMHVVAGYMDLDLVVNELTGAVKAESTCHHDDVITVVGSVGLSNHDPAQQQTAQPMPGVTVDCGGNGVFQTDLNGQATVPDGSNATIQLIGLHSHIVRLDQPTEQNIAVSGTDTADFNNTSEFPKAENDAYYHTDFVWRWLSTRIDTAVNDSYFDTFALETDVNHSASGNADFSDSGGQLNGGTTPRIRFFRANGTYRSTAMSDVVYHEYGHYADWAMGGLISDGGLSEGWGDIVAAFITGDPELGEGFRQADDPVNGSGLRTCANNYQWNGNDEIHTAGTAWSGFAWRVRQGLIAAEIAGNYVGPPSAIEYAEQLIFGALDANTTSVPDSITWVDIFDVLNGGDSFTQQIIDDAAGAQGLGSYTAPPFRILTMTADVGFIWEGANTVINIDVTVQNTDSADHAIDVAIAGASVAIAGQSSALLGPGQSEVLHFTWDTSSATAGDYTVVATATVTGLPDDDTAQVNVTVGPANGLSVFFDDFESGLAKWPTVTGSWGIETDAAKSYSGTHSASESPAGDYSPVSNTMMISQPFSLVGVSGARISLYHQHTIEDGWDYGTIEMNSNGGQFTTVGIVTGILGLHHESFDASALDGRANVRLRLRFWTDPGSNMDGWNVDDIRVFGANTPGNGAPTPTVVASDGFESNDFTGGSGWNASWTTSGNADVQTTGPAAGTRHARVRGSGTPGNRGRIERFCDITGVQQPRISFLLWTGGTIPDAYQPGDQMHISLSDNNGSSWTPWTTIYNAHSSGNFDYHKFDIAVADLGLTATSTFGIRIDADQVGGSTRHTYIDEVTVYGTNYPPVFDPIADPTTEANVEVAFTVSATDPENDTVTLSATLLPGGATFNPATGAFAWTPGAADVGQQFAATFEADDGINTPASMTVTIMVDTNDAPVIDAISDKSVAAGALLDFIVNATDGDGDPVALSATGLPGSATFNTSTGEFTWSPADGDVAGSPYTVTFSADDGVNTPVTLDVMITVTESSSGGDDSNGKGGCVAGAAGAPGSALAHLLLMLIGVLGLAAVRRRS